MVANSFIEIYTLLFAWDVYEGIWDMLTGTGLALLPFFGVLLSAGKNFLEDDAESVLAEMEVSFVTMMLVLIFCVLPFAGFTDSLASVNYTLDAPDCQLRAAPDSMKNGTGDSVGTDDQLYDTTFADMNGQTVRRPVLWVVAQKLSSAVTRTAISSMQCVNNYSLMLSRIADYKIDRPETIEQIEQFTEKCYNKAMHRYKQNPIALPDDTPAIAQLDWIGSTTLLNVDNEYYEHPKAFMVNMDRYGFDRNTDRPSDAYTESGANPSCKEVWLGEEYFLVGNATGLRNKLLDEIDTDEVGDIVQDWDEWGSQVFSVGEMSERDKQDLLLKLIIEAQDVAPVSSFEVAGQPNKRNIDSFGDALDMGRDVIKANIGAVTTNVTGLFEAVSLTGEKHKLRVLGPIVIAMLQMIVIFASPIFMVVKGYDLKTFLTLTFTYFALEFIHAIWAAGFWFEQKLVDLYSSHAGTVGSVINSIMLENLGATMLFIMPAIWLMLCAKYGGSAISVVGTTGAAPSGGGGGNNTAGNAAGRVMKKVLTKGAG